MLSKVTEKIYVRAKNRTCIFEEKYPKYWTIFSVQHTLLSLSYQVNTYKDIQFSFC